MKRYLAFRYNGGKDVLFAYLLEAEIEDVDSWRNPPNIDRLILSIDPSLAHDILQPFGKNLPIYLFCTEAVAINDMEVTPFRAKDG